MSDGEDENGHPDRPIPAAPPNADLLARKRFAANDKDFDGANDEAMSIRLAMVEQEHRDLDAAITSLEMNSPYERLTIARLKKKKLALKDLIQEIKDAMLPDIIA